MPKSPGATLFKRLRLRTGCGSMEMAVSVRFWGKCPRVDSGVQIPSEQIALILL